MFIMALDRRNILLLWAKSTSIAVKIWCPLSWWQMIIWKRRGHLHSRRILQLLLSKLGRCLWEWNHINRLLQIIHQQGIYPPTPINSFPWEPLPHPMRHPCPLHGTIVWPILIPKAYLIVVGRHKKVILGSMLYPHNIILAFYPQGHKSQRHHPFMPLRKIYHLRTILYTLDLSRSII